jgi:formyl-CoA transferase
MSTTVGIDVTTTMYREMEDVLRTRPSAEWLDVFRRADVPAAPCLTLDQHLGDDQTGHNELYEVREWPGWEEVGPMRHVRHPAMFSSFDPPFPRVGPPVLPDRAPRVPPP